LNLEVGHTDTFDGWLARMSAAPAYAEKKSELELGPAGETSPTRGAWKVLFAEVSCHRLALALACLSSPSHCRRLACVCDVLWCA
jgi:hypothetical protein